MTVGELIDALMKVDRTLEVYIGKSMDSLEIAGLVAEIRHLHDTGSVPYVVITSDYCI